MNPTSSEHLLQERGYEVLGTVGEGAYSKVKLFYSRPLTKNVAIKIINKNLAPKDFVHQFLPREIDILQKVRHDNIIDVFEILATNDGRIFVIMEHALHDDLLRHIQKHGAIEEGRASLLYGMLASAVEYLHDRKIVHRDLKCENLLLTGTAMVQQGQGVERKNMSEMGLFGANPSEVSRKKIEPVPLEGMFNRNAVKLILADFGFSREFESDSDRSNTFCGSAAYAAPEIIKGEPYKLKNHDMWSLGVILFIMVCGTMPFDDSNIRKMLKDQLNHRLRYPPQAAFTVSSKCKDLIRKLIEPNTRERLDIQQVLEHEWLAGKRLTEKAIMDRQQTESSATIQIPQSSRKSTTRHSNSTRNESVSQVPKPANGRSSRRSRVSELNAEQGASTRRYQAKAPHKDQDNFPNWC